MQKWSELLSKNSLQKAAALSEKAQSERDAGRTIYPPQSQIFRALTLTPPEQVRVVIVGQDPYHGPGQANGLAFSVNPGVPLPPSLRNIFREMREDIGAKMPESGDLTPWAERGVLLLNTVLTVQDGQANSHKNWGWQDFVLDVFQNCAALPQPVVFLLWGRQAQAFVSSLPFDRVQNKRVLCSSHPSPLGAGKGSANVPAFLGSRPFSRTNQLLQEMGAEPINWELYGNIHFERKSWYIPQLTRERGDMMNRDFLKDLLSTPSVSGYEETIQKKALAYGREFAGAQLTDPSGNAISAVNPEARHKVLLCGHIDEIGFVVTHIDASGRLSLMGAGGVRPRLYLGSPVQIWHEGKMVSGVVVTSGDLLKKDKTEVSDLLVDIGANSREEAAQVVSVGDPVCADVQVRELLNDCFTCRALDDRTGAFVVLEAARQAAAKGASIGIYAATTVGEETTGRGAYYAAARVKPDCAIAVDVTWASDAPGTKPSDTGEVKLGGGPVLCMASSVNKKMNALLKQTADDLGIGLQWEIATGRTGTDGDTVNRVGEGVPMALVSIPLRYMHSSVEVGCWKDLENCIDLLSAFLVRLSEEMEKGFDFCPLKP